jgi:hypothetical protein
MAIIPNFDAAVKPVVRVVRVLYPPRATGACLTSRFHGGCGSVAFTPDSDDEGTRFIHIWPKHAKTGAFLRKVVAGYKHRSPIAHYGAPLPCLGSWNWGAKRQGGDESIVSERATPKPY